MRRWRSGRYALGLSLVGLGAACPAPTPAVPPPGIFHVAPHGDDHGPGTAERPWATLHHAALTAGPGDRVLVHGGTHAIDSPIRLRRSGTPDAWITYAAAPGERVIIDASAIPVSVPQGSPPYDVDQGAFQIEGVAYVRVQGLAIHDSHRGGFIVRDSHHVALLHNEVHRSFGSGIAAWDSQHDGVGTEHIEIRGNTIDRPNTWEMLPPGWPRTRYTPHEGITVAGVRHFEVAGNHVHHGDKEGIDVKNDSRHGRVHHNHVHHMAHQGLYVDGWFAPLRDVEFDHNEVHDCRGAGLVISVENGPSVEDVWVHDNVLYDNEGSGILLSRWGDGPRRGLRIEHNTIHHNGHGEPQGDHPHYWITGGIYLFSANVHDVVIRDNVLSDNRAFQIGLSAHWLTGGLDPEAALREHGVVIERNVVDVSVDATPPIPVGWAEEDRTEVTPLRGRDAIDGTPSYVAPERGDFRLRPGSVGADGPRGARLGP